MRSFIAILLFSLCANPLAVAKRARRSAPVAAWVPAPVETTPGSWNAFLITLKAAWEHERPKLPYELNGWMIRVLDRDHKNAAHLWSVVMPEAPASFVSVCRAAYLYSLWNLKLPQTFFEEWMEALEDKRFREGPLARHLESAVAPHLERWVYHSYVKVTPAQKATLEKLVESGRTGVLPILAWASLRSGVSAQSLLPRLTQKHTLRPWLVRSILFDLSRQNRMKEAQELLRREKTALKHKGKNAKSYPLLEARLKYQMGDLKAAENAYLQVPASTPESFSAREEVFWVWLRTGMSVRLRGEVVSTETLLKERDFAPDVFVVQALSNLKLCYFDRVQTDLMHFRDESSRWGKQIERALSRNEAPYWGKDLFTQIEEKRLVQLEKEMAAVTALEVESLEGPLPGVGVQPHWTGLRKKLQTLAYTSRNDIKKEYARQWDYRKARLAGSIRRMRFVQAEYTNQLRRFSKSDSALSEDLAETQTAQIEARTEKSRETALAQGESDLSFPVDEVLWEDEIFHIRSAAQTMCLKALEKKDG